MSLSLELLGIFGGGDGDLIWVFFGEGDSLSLELRLMAFFFCEDDSLSLELKSIALLWGDVELLWFFLEGAGDSVPLELKLIPIFATEEDSSSLVLLPDLMTFFLGMGEDEVLRFFFGALLDSEVEMVASFFGGGEEEELLELRLMAFF